MLCTKTLASDLAKLKPDSDSLPVVNTLNRNPAETFSTELPIHLPFKVNYHGLLSPRQFSLFSCKVWMPS